MDPESNKDKLLKKLKENYRKNATKNMAPTAEAPNKPENNQPDGW